MVESDRFKEKNHVKVVPAEMPSNELYFVVLPLIHLETDKFGRTEQVLTLLPDKSFATEFFEDEVGGYISTFEHRQKLLSGGHVVGYALQQVQIGDGRVIVRVVQDVKK